MPSLYELTSNYRQLMEFAGEMDAEVFEDTLAAITDGIEIKAENIAYVVRNMEADAAVIKEEEQRLADRRKAMENRVKNLKQYLLEQLDAAGIKKVQAAKITVSIANNAPSVVVSDESTLPEQYLVPQPPKVDKKAIGVALKAGEEVPGCSLVAGKSVRIK